MASLIIKKTGSMAVQVVMPDGKRKTIGIGKPKNQSQADTYLRHIEELATALLGGYGIPRATAVWLKSINRTLRRRLEQLELVPKAEEAVERQSTLAALIESYLGDCDVKARTVVRYGNQLAFVQRHFGPSRDITSITQADGDRFLKWLKKQKKSNGEPLAPSYINKVLKTSRQAFAYAVADRVISENPLQCRSVAETKDCERDYEVTRAMTVQMLKASPYKYELVIALARFGGLRCPSELVGLKWPDIDWDQNRFTVRSPKTEHFGKAERVVPLFPELVPYLEQARSRSRSKKGRVFPWVTEETNLRTCLLYTSDAADE